MMRPVHPRILAAAALAALALAACSSAAPGPPSARSVITKIPGCSRPSLPSGGADVQARQELRCDNRDASIFLATFTSAALERQWIIAQNAGVCSLIQGPGWAALVLPQVSDACGYDARLARLLGGRVVSS
jgi:hypothetical protein